MPILAAAQPSLEISGTVTWLLLLGTGCTALLAIWGVITKILNPMLRVAAVIEEAFPVWVGIAKEFRDEHGGERLSVELGAMAANQRATAAVAGEIAIKVDGVRSKLDENSEKLDELHEYAHTMNHDIIGEVAKLRMADGSMPTLVESILATAEEVRRVRTLLEKEEHQ